MSKSLVTLALIGTLTLTGCGAFKNKLSKMGEALTTGNYIVTVWSGDKAVRTYHIVNGYVNQEVDTDGWFFFVDGKMVRVSGTVTIEQQ